MKIYKCNICGQIISKVKETPVPVMCCGQPMKQLVAGEVDASHEKHVPVYTVSSNKVEVVVGSTIHPMTQEHYIEWISIETNIGYQIRHLLPTSVPQATFYLSDNEKVLNVYAYCNLHGLWKA